ncbi:uncharacterized protein LOC123706008 [Colias croceus]|uniref:uncharacterized protein LOC123706008 n=1 Tax=Colias crocea TaxID=72248 RepID=UPI001E27A581|nr:uncharacterized protein LOC123706008 [Colias croceus]
MSSSKTRKRKAFVKGPVIESDNETTEVLVLPPKLLEKLGISIGNIDAGLKDQINYGGSDLILHNELDNSALFQMSSPKTNNVDPDTSIMETANLMKESVFLSPTFSSSSVSVPSYIGDDIVSSTSSLDENGKDKKIDIEFENIESNFINHEIVSSTKENAKDLINENNDKQIAKSHDFAFKDKNKDIQILNQDIITNGIKSKIRPNNKICVISEEVITPCNMKELKTFDKTSNSTLIPIPINSIITTEKIKEKSKNSQNKNKFDCNSKQLNTKSIQNNDNVENINNISKDNSTNTVSISLSDSLNNIVINNNYENSNTKMLNGEVVDKNTPGGDFIKTQNHGNSEEVDFNLKSDLISDKFISFSKDDLKIEQIAGENGITAEKAHCTEINGNEMMLPPENKKSNQEEYVQSSDMLILNPKEMLDQTHHKANNDKDDSFQNNFNNSLIFKDCPLNKNRCVIQSKLHIQGVEKPGGHDLVNRNTIAIRKNKDSLRTYTRKPLKIHVPLRETYNKPLIQDLSSDTIEISEMLNEHAFCVCHDFGHYSYYDEKETYEHLHFLTGNSVQCSSDIIFSIYSDDYKLIPVDDQQFEEILEGFGEEIKADVANEDSKICYNYISHEFDMNMEIQSNIDNKSNKMNQTILEDNMKDDNITTDDNHTNISTLVNEPQPATITTDAKRQPASDTIILSNVCTPESMDSGEKRKFEIEIEIAPNPCNIEDDDLQKPIMTRGKRKRLESDHTPLIHLKKKPKVVNSKNNANYDDKISQECPETRQSDVNQSFLSDTTDVNLKIEKEEQNDTVICGVCQLKLRNNMWIAHISREHSYLAWRETDTPLDFSNEDVVYDHLNKILNQLGHLICGRCGIERESTKKYLRHVNKCSVVPGVCFIDVPSGAHVVKCGVCHKDVADFIGHIAKEHNYLAWREGELPIDFKDERIARQYLHSIAKQIGGLTCAKCGCCRKYVKAYLDHINTCDAEKSNDEPGEVVKCGVCQEEVSYWYTHIGEKHNYIAWADGEPAINISDDESVQKHLNAIVKQIGELVCSKCGYHRKNVNSYLNHIKVCEGLMNTTLNSTLDSTLDSTRNTVKCGVCDKEVREKNWIKHIQQEHNYIAWTQDGEPLDTNDKEAVYDYLYNISKEYNGLICSKCGIRRKYVKLYLSHIKTCTGSNDNSNNSEADVSNLDSSVAEDTALESGLLVKCGVCQKEVTNGSWLRHIEKEHDYIAWKENETPLNTNNKNEVHDYLYNITKQNNGLVCSQCGCRRKYVKAYLDHIKACKNEHSDTPNDSLLNSSNVDGNSSNSSIKNESKKCGVCQEEVEDDLWLNHIEEKHNYMAWRENEQPLNSSDKDEIYEHLYNISKQNNGLLCLKCGCRRKYVKSYLSHIKGCTGNPDCTNDSIADTSNLDQSIVDTNDKAPVKCGVCQKEMEGGNWVTHIKEEHDYIAWKENEAPLDVNDYDALYQHYYNIVQTYGQLTCKKCGCQRKYAKSYMSHVQSCTGDFLDPTFVQIQKETQDNKIVKCGVCQLEMENKRWTTHIQRFHKYVAWQEGETPLDTEDENQVNEHLYNMSKKYDGLTCAKCNVTKKYVKVFLAHIASCDVDVDVSALPDYETNTDTYECALCHETGPISEWKKHAMKKHYNVAWMVGDVPIDLKNLPCVEKYLKEYQKYHKILRCLECGMVRISITGFYAHVMFCGKTEEEKDMYKSYCEICNNKYIGVYKAQHMKAHREQEYAQMNKQMIEARQEAMLNQKPEDEETPGKRRAAEKAKNVIKNITTKTEDKENTDDDISDDNYDETRDDTSSESDDSVTIEPTSDEESIDTEIDSDVSNDDKIEVKRKKKYGESSFATINNKRIPFTVSQPAAYISDSAKEFFKTHYTSSTLFPQWLSCEYEAVPEDQLAKYMPPLAKSCNVMYSTDGWTTYDRFEARKGKGLSLFVGASINNIRWVPPRRTGDNTPYLSVNCYNGPDAPRLDVTQTVEHPAMIQIWDFHDMSDLPSFVFGIAHDLGTVWSMDWCPSGACEILNDEKTKGFTRLGLLAVACSSGSAYIFSVPHPSSIVESDKLVYKLKPVVELRMCRSKNQKFQSTAISWSNNKGHACIIVGYSNGATANFDLNTDSPLLTCVEDGVTVFYPFHDEKSHSACVSDVVSLCGGAGGAEWRWAGSCSASATGTTAVLGTPAATAGTAHVQLTATHVAREPLWPAALLAGNSDIVSQAINEVDWWGSGRRFGPVSAACGCGLCARVAAFIPPLLKTMFLHPVFHDKRELQVRIKIDMVPLKENKDSKKKAEQPLKLDSYVYEEVTKYYGIEYKYASDLDKSDIQHHLNKPRKKSPDQFPLAEVTSMEFCPVPIYHKKLAIATHSGMLFVINT